VSSERQGLHPGQTADVYQGDLFIGYAGRIHPSAQKALGLSQPVYIAELDRVALSNRSISAFQPVSRFPEVRRDLAVLVDASVNVGNLVSLVIDSAGVLAKSAFVFDIYTGQGVPEGKKSVALGLTLVEQSRTLSDSEVNDVMTQVIESLKKKFDAELR
jgi:phenylalanyl-tRNA synthetase beta chain